MIRALDNFKDELVSRWNNQKGDIQKGTDDKSKPLSDIAPADVSASQNSEFGNNLQRALKEARTAKDIRNKP